MNPCIKCVISGWMDAAFNHEQFEHDTFVIFVLDGVNLVYSRVYCTCICAFILCVFNFVSFLLLSVKLLTCVPRARFLYK